MLLSEVTCYRLIFLRVFDISALKGTNGPVLPLARVVVSNLDLS